MNPLRRPGIGFALMLLGVASCTAVLGDGRYYVAAEGESDASVDAGGGGDDRRECMPGAKRCSPGGVQTCSPSGEWQTAQSCPFGCSRGTCTGKCVPGEAQCDGAAKQTCDSTGAWQTTQTCPFACMGSGTCVGVCSPNAARCSGPTPQRCDVTGSWVNQTGCAQPAPDCQNGACTCLEAMCGGACLDLQSDPKNCGVCGHDCKGQACQKGLCQPATLASSLATPWGVAIAGTSVYWTNSGDGTVMTLPVAGGVTPTTLANGQGTPLGIALDAADAYWVDGAGGIILQCALSGCGGVPRVLASGRTSPWGVAVDSTSAYWTEGTAIARAALTDATLTPVGTDPKAAYPVAVDGVSAYWGDAVGSVYKCAVAGCSTPTILASTVLKGAVQGLVIDAGNVYWTNRDVGAVAMVPKSGGTTTVLASSLSSPIGIAVDATTVYWANSGDGTVMKIPIAGGSAVTIATGQSGPFGVAVDSSYVYWTDQMGGSVMRVVK